MAYDPNDAADKKIFDDAIAEATAGLVTKRDQLLTEVKTLKAQIKNGAADPAAVERLQGQLDDANVRIETINGELSTTKRQLGKVTKDYETETGFTKNLLVDNGLTEALVSANVAKQFLPAVKALFAGKVEIKTEGNERKAFIGDKPLGEAITAFAQSDEGKHYVAAGNNSGGSANGSGGAKATGKTITRSAFDALPPAARPAALADGATVIDG